MRFPWLEESAIEAAAHRLLVGTFGPSPERGRPVDLEAVVFDYLSEREGLHFSNESDLGSQYGEEILGRTFPIAGRIEISSTLNTPDQLGRYRFTLAHELGHWVLHRPLFLAGAQTLDLLEAASSNLVLTSLHRGVFPAASSASAPPEEWQANRFAIALLVDRHALREAFEARFGPDPVARESPDWCLSQDLRRHARRCVFRCIRTPSSVDVGHPVRPKPDTRFG